MSKFITLYDPEGELRPQPTSLWWRRTLTPSEDGWNFIFGWDNPDDPWVIWLEIYDRLSVQLPIDGFKVIEHKPILEDLRSGITTISARPNPWLDILAPFPPSITGWEPLAWTGDHTWPGVGDDGYRQNWRGTTVSHVWGTRPDAQPNRRRGSSMLFL